MGEIRFVGTGETRGYPSLVCKKRHYKSCISAILLQNMDCTGPGLYRARLFKASLA